MLGAFYRCMVEPINFTTCQLWNQQVVGGGGGGGGEGGDRKLLCGLPPFNNPGSDSNCCPFYP